jgi:ABC-type multidrug transport system ATPase subunit
MLPILLGYMTIIPKKINTKGGSSYYKLVDVKRVNGKVVQKYVGYLGKDPNSKKEITGKDILPYVERLLDIEITDVEIKDILKKIGIDCDISPITKIVLENDRKLKKTFLRLK